jgi:hypothetical protein
VRRLALSILLVTLLGVPAAAYALERSADDGTLSVKHARGLVYLRLNGAIIGRMGHGDVTIVDPISDDGTGPLVWGCERHQDASSNTQNPNDTIILCSGNDLRFRMAGGRYRVTMRGTGIFVSAVGHGRVTFDAPGDDPGADKDGIYSINNTPYLPVTGSVSDFMIAAPSGP